MTIQVSLSSNEFQRSGEYNNHQYTSLRIDRISNGRVYFTTIKDQIKWSTMIKQMKLDNGNVIISFGKNDKLIIGTYTDTKEVVVTPVNEVSEPIKEVSEPTQQTTEEDNEEVVTINCSKSLHGFGQSVYVNDNRNTNNTMTYFNPKGNDSIIISIHHNNYNKYWEVEKFIYSIMKEYGTHTDFWSILIGELNTKYINTKQEVKTESKPTEKPNKATEPIQKIDMIANYALITYSGNKTVITFTNNKESNTINFDYKRSWSHRKYIDTALQQTGIKPSWEFRYGWEYKAV